jgi:hypothetical protein
MVRDLFAVPDIDHTALVTVWEGILYLRSKAKICSSLPIDHHDAVHLWSWLEAKGWTAPDDTDADEETLHRSPRPCIAMLLQDVSPATRQWIWDQMQTTYLDAVDRHTPDGDISIRLAMLDVLCRIQPDDTFPLAAMWDMVIDSLSHPSETVVMRAIDVLAAWHRGTNTDVSVRAGDILLRLIWGAQAHPSDDIRWYACQSVADMVGPTVATYPERWNTVLTWSRNHPVLQVRFWAYRFMATWCPPHRLSEMVALLATETALASFRTLPDLCEAWNILVGRYPDVSLPGAERWVRNACFIMERSCVYEDLMVMAHSLNLGLRHAWLGPIVADHLVACYQRIPTRILESIGTMLLRGPWHSRCIPSMTLLCDRLIRAGDADVVLNAITEQWQDWEDGHADHLIALLLSHIDQIPPDHRARVLATGVRMTGDPSLVTTLIDLLSRSDLSLATRHHGIEMILACPCHDPIVMPWLVERLKQEPNLMTGTIAEMLWMRQPTQSMLALIDDVLSRDVQAALLLATHGWGRGVDDRIVDRIVRVIHDEHAQPQDIADGLSSIVRSPTLDPVTTCALLTNLGTVPHFRMMVVHAIRDGWGSPITPYIPQILHTIAAHTVAEAQRRGWTDADVTLLSDVIKGIGRGWEYGDDRTVLGTIQSLISYVENHGPISPQLLYHGIDAIGRGWGRGDDGEIVSVLDRVIHIIPRLHDHRYAVIASIVRMISDASATIGLQQRHRIMRTMLTTVPDAKHDVPTFLQRMVESFTYS